MDAYIKKLALAGIDVEQLLVRIEEVVNNVVEELKNADAQLELEVYWVGLYGSRLHGNSVREDSDLDILVGYTGNIKEYRFFNRLSEENLIVNGMKVDFNPIRPDESGTVYDYMKKDKAYNQKKFANISIH